MLLQTAFAALSLSALANGAGNGTLIKIGQGNVQGTLVAPTVRQFLGIPFAANAGGTNRWKAPQAAPKFNGTFSATAFGDSCPQDANAGNVAFLTLINNTQPVPESEDCLNLNIWAPSVDRKQKTAVMIWIYGGGFEFGTVSHFNQS